mmetsp:Transcript_10863/g.10878  ORF Transcript_10863/g.10878 Transcript_10863/m.10878 type:complete len:103 (+) Transcript_10863:45-353(+)
MRGTVIGLNSLLDNISKGIGPIIIAILIRICNGRQAAFNYGISMWAICAMFYCLMAFTVVSDEALIRERVEAVLNTSSLLDEDNHTDLEENIYDCDNFKPTA